MFKNLLINLTIATACIGNAMEVAKKHFDDMQAQFKAGQICMLDLLRAEGDLLQAEISTCAKEVTQEKLNRYKELRKKAYELAEARYKEGLCSYMIVFETKEQKLFTCDGLEACEDFLKEQESIIATQVQSGTSDYVDQLEMKRRLLTKQAFDASTSPESRHKLLREIEQNFQEAEQLALIRYKEGLVPYETVSRIQEQHEYFPLMLEYFTQLYNPPRWNQLKQRHAEIAKQRYENLVSTPEATPFILLRARLDYLNGKRIAEKNQKSSEK